MNLMVNETLAEVYENTYLGGAGRPPGLSELVSVLSLFALIVRIGASTRLSNTGLLHSTVNELAFAISKRSHFTTRRTVNYFDLLVRATAAYRIAEISNALLLHLYGYRQSFWDPPTEKYERNYR